MRINSVGMNATNFGLLTKSADKRLKIRNTDRTNLQMNNNLKNYLKDTTDYIVHHNGKENRFEVYSVYYQYAKRIPDKKGTRMKEILLSIIDNINDIKESEEKCPWLRMNKLTPEFILNGTYIE